MKASIVTTCKGWLSHLRRSLPLMLERTPADIVVVDAQGPDFSGAWVESLHDPRLCVERVPMEKWDPSLARNGGAARAIANGATHLVFLDADALITKGFWGQLIFDDAFCIINPVPTTEVLGMLVVGVELFQSVGGYASYKPILEDLDLRMRAYERVQRVHLISPAFLGVLHHSSKTRAHADPEYVRKAEDSLERYRVALDPVTHRILAGYDFVKVGR